MSRFYVTSPIYYATEAPHVGHTLTTVLCDVLARAHATLISQDGLAEADLETGVLMRDGASFFLTGTDEHGAKVAQKAEEAGAPPQDFVNAIAAQYREAWELLQIHPSAFIQTTNPRHEAYVREIAQAMFDKGDIYKGSFVGLYCTACESFKTANDLTPDGLCPDHLRKPEEVREENYFFKLSAYQARIIEHIETHPDFIRPANRRSEVLSFLKSQDLQDLSVSRPSVKWGVSLPFDPAHTAYVWIDALFNYVSALKMLGEQVFEEFWPANIQLMGKEITRFHAVYWPAFLMSAGLALPEAIVAHGWFTVEGQKMSKTIGNFIPPAQLVARYGVDGTRYLLATAMRLENDGDISRDTMDRRYVSELSNGFGNLVNRVVTLATKYLGQAEWVAPDLSLIPDLAAWREETLAAYRNGDVFTAAESAFRLIDRGNKLVDEKKLWILAKEDLAAFAVVAATLKEVIQAASELLEPIMPAACGAARNALTERAAVILFPRLAEEGA